MALITSTSDPTLWGQLEASHDQDPNASFVMHGGKTYRVIQETTNTVAYLLKTNEELFDSRSITGSKPASYNKLDP